MKKFANASDIRFLKIDLVVVDSKKVLKVRGFLMHSSLALKKPEIEVDGDDVIISIEVVPTGSGRSGALDIDIPINTTIKRVVLGPAKDELWPKAPSVRPLK